MRPTLPWKAFAAIAPLTLAGACSYAPFYRTDSQTVPRMTRQEALDILTKPPTNVFNRVAYGGLGTDGGAIAREERCQLSVYRDGLKFQCDRHGILDCPYESLRDPMVSKLQGAEMYSLDLRPECNVEISFTNQSGRNSQTWANAIYVLKHRSEYPEGSQAASDTEFVGVGLRLDFKTGAAVVQEPIEGSPAMAAGVMRGDRIDAIDGVSTAGLKSEEIVSRIRGPSGITVRLTVSRPGESASREFKIARVKVKLDPRKEFERSQAEAEKGGGAAEYDLATRYYNGNGTERDYAQALAWARKAAEQGDSNAQILVGAIYMQGLGVQKDVSEAEAWWRKAANQGNAWAYVKLGASAYEAKSFKDSEYWNRLAAKQKNSAGQFNMGDCYEKGWSCPQDFVEAYRWFSLAASQGVEQARERRDALAARMTKEQIAQAQSGAPSATPAAKEAAAAPETATASSDIDVPGYHLGQRAADFALIIGVSKYSKLPEAPFAERDAETVKKHLLALGIPPRNIIHLVGPDATRGAIQGYVEEWLPKNVKPESTVFIYYSGHGAPDPQTGTAYLVPWDGDATFLQSTAYPLKRLYGSLSKLQAKGVVVALDSCFSGAGGRSVLAKGARPLVTKVDEGFGKNSGLTLLAAASSDQITGTLDEQGHGLFTYFLLKGLGGAAKDGSGAVTAKSLYEYLKPNVEDEAHRQNREQTPTFGGEDLELASFK